MIYKKRLFLVTLLIIIFIQFLLYKNNNQKTTFRYLIWEVQELSIGKLISISFVSGFLISNVLNEIIKTKNIRNFRKDKKEIDEDFENNINNEEFISNPDIPPQRDIRDPQPTISVNYRVVKNNGDNYQKNEEEISNNEKYGDDWSFERKEW